MDGDFALQLEFGNTAEILAKNFFLNLELILVAGVLIVASSAGSEVRASGLDAMRRRLGDRGNLRASETGLFLGEHRFDFFSGQNERGENGFAAAVRGGGKTSESVAAVDELFNI